MDYFQIWAKWRHSNSHKSKVYLINLTTKLWIKIIWRAYKWNGTKNEDEIANFSCNVTMDNNVVYGIQVKSMCPMFIEH